MSNSHVMKARPATSKIDLVSPGGRRDSSSARSARGTSSSRSVGKFQAESKKSLKVDKIDPIYQNRDPISVSVK